MHGIGRQPLGDGRRPHDLRRGRDALLGEAAGGILGGEQLADLAGGIGQRRRHRVPAVEHGQVVRPQALALGALEAFAPLDLLAGRAGLGAGSLGFGRWRVSALASAGWSVSPRYRPPPVPAIAYGSENAGRG